MNTDAEDKETEMLLISVIGSGLHKALANPYGADGYFPVWKLMVFAV